MFQAAFVGGVLPHKAECSHCVLDTKTVVTLCDSQVERSCIIQELNFLTDKKLLCCGIQHVSRSRMNQGLHDTNMSVYKEDPKEASLLRSH